MDERGRAKALQVEFLTSSHEPHLFYWTPIAIATLGIASVFLIGLVFAGFTKHLPLAIPVVYTILSVITFQQYLIDKKAAQSDRWRIPEKQLHLLSLLGGWPGALVAQQGLRHKSRKTSFLIPFCITIGLNLAPLVLFFYYLGN
ncbi:MAG: DUF1294 domain-containing protein [Armatimonadetes bacterium]|nr:DUF1294 domain-containing protein [Armatimonadota bacterium]